MSIDSTTLQGSIQRLFPELDADEVLAELLLERARRNLVKYRTMARDFEAKYSTDFQTFRQQVWNRKRLSRQSRTTLTGNWR